MFNWVIEYHGSHGVAQAQYHAVDENEAIAFFQAEHDDAPILDVWDTGHVETATDDHVALLFDLYMNR